VKKARKLLRDSYTSGLVLIAPPLFEYEMESVIQTFHEQGLLTVAQSDTALANLAGIGIQLVTHPTMVSRAREFARRFHQPKIYDSLYAALADLRGCEFWTADTAFWNAMHVALPFVKHLPAYP
jgi:predicted nucleic acid-binding protein